MNRVLFPIDHDDEYVEVREQYPLKGLQLLRTLWNDPKKVITVLNGNRLSKVQISNGERS